MSVIGEVVGTVACVAAIISAYHDGGAIIQRIKIKRAEKQAPAPPRLLEESIDEAPQEIEKEKKRGIDRFGKAFEDGDHRAVIALQQITIQLQSSLLAKLREASYNDGAVDFTPLIDAADLGRDGTKGVLLELKQRLLQAAPISQISEPGPYHGLASQVSKVSVQTGSGSSPESTSAPTSETVQRRVSEEQRLLPGEAGATAGAHDNRQSRRHRHNSLFERFKPHRTSSGLSNHKSDEAGMRPSTSVQAAPAVKSSHEETSRQPYTYADGEDNPFEIWGKPTRDAQFTDTLSASYNNLASAPASNLFSFPFATRQLSTIPSGVSPRSASASSLQPNPENNYLGFCKGAARLQNGDRKGMQRTKEFNDGWSHSTVYYLSCSNSKCAFAGHMDLELIWTKVWDCNEKGLKFRWPFLAKSHVCQNKVKNQLFAYQCLFCVFLGNQPPVLHGTDLYLDHVSQEHRGRKLGDVVLFRTCCVNDRVCGDNEEFDINLFPLTAIESARMRKQSKVLSDDLVVGPASDAQDSLFSNEPWNEGLSEFQYTDEYEHGGRLSLRSWRSNGTG